MRDIQTLDIINEGEGAFDMVFDGGEEWYDINNDPFTGDWNVLIEDEDFIMSQYFLTKDDAVKFVLHREGILDEKDYNEAPDRC